MNTETRELEVGQKVRITAKNHAFYGDEGVIARVPNMPWNSYTVSFGDRYGARYFDRSEFAIVESASFELEITVYSTNEFNEENYSARTHMNVYPGHSSPNYRTPVAAIKSQKEHYAKQGFYITWKVRRLAYNLG